MKIIVDNKIPYIHEAVEQIADEVVYLPGSGFTAGDVRDADALVWTIVMRRELYGKIVPVVMPAVWSSTCIRYYYC